jgi:hypothetical protein
MKLSKIILTLMKVSNRTKMNFPCMSITLFSSDLNKEVGQYPPYTKKIKNMKLKKLYQHRQLY